ncbi:MAG: quinolinate synthase NadA [Candidatus Dadabacteria bacterium]|nr:MAG: quinolinate synthase NadA [Candidatus Dadabacteria bacterium]
MAIPADASLDKTREILRARLKGIIPDFEIDYKAELAWKINRLKHERGAVILGHNYMEPALFYSIPDYVGDSLELARKAAETNCDPIVFCGVRFMAETAKILNPDKTVLLPSKEAGCSLAAAITADDVRRLKELFPGAPVVSYVNTYADVKAESDYCCTSSNAARLVKSIDADLIIFLPDEYLAKNVAAETGRKIWIFGPEDLESESIVYPDDVSMIGWAGRCEVHEQFTVEDVTSVRKQFPKVEVLAHPECRPEVVEAADFSQSTSRMIQHVKESTAPHFLLLTECSMGDNIIAENPDKDILRLCSVRCPHMNQITLEDTLEALEKNQVEIDVPEPIRTRAKQALERMLSVS